jgi:hypothetical protein
MQVRRHRNERYAKGHPVNLDRIARATLERELRFVGFELSTGRPLAGIAADHLIAHGATRGKVAWFEHKGTDAAAVRRDS